MRIRKETVTYKLPKPFLDAYQDTLDCIDWKAMQTVEIDMGDGGKAGLEVVAGRGGAVVRPATPKSANLIRRFSDAIASADPERYPPPSAEQVALVLAKRNPDLDEAP